MGKSLTAGLLFWAVLQCPVTGQQRKPMEPEPTARVEVVAFEANGRFLGAPNVSVFAESESGQNLATKFHNGLAVDIPYGIYRIEGRLPWYYSDTKFVWVYQPLVTVVLGLRFSQELPKVPPTLRGHVTGVPVSTTKAFVKLIGVYEHVSVESLIEGDGTFSLGGLSPGAFLLLVVGEHGIVASRTLTIPYTGPPLEIAIKEEP